MIRARKPSNLRKVLRCLNTTNRPVTPEISGWALASPQRAHHTGARTGNAPAREFSLGVSSSTKDPIHPTYATCQVHQTRATIEHIPTPAMSLRSSTLWVKFRTYHAPPPQRATMRRSTYQPGGMGGRVGPTNNDISGALGSVYSHWACGLAWPMLGASGASGSVQIWTGPPLLQPIVGVLGLRAGRVISLYPEIALTHLFGLKG